MELFFIFVSLEISPKAWLLISEKSILTISLPLLLTHFEFIIYYKDHLSYTFFISIPSNTSLAFSSFIMLKSISLSYTYLYSSFTEQASSNGVLPQQIS